MCLIAIHPDDYTAAGKPTESDASSPRWARLLERAGHRVRWVNVYDADILDQIDGCHGFMWRWAHFGGMYRIAHRLLPVLERELGLIVYPDQPTCWHYDDKIAQHYLLHAAGIAAPATWVWFDRERASDWCTSADYPAVLKLHTGAGSVNVRLIHSAEEARRWIGRLFGPGVVDLSDRNPVYHIPTWGKRVRVAARALIKGQPTVPSKDIIRGYFLVQEFLPDNPFDTRVTVIGDRAFAFRRFNREGDFRASGSGKIDWDPLEVDERFVRLAYQVAETLATQSCAIDGLYRANTPVVGEISYTYVSSAIHACPGHWELEGDARTGRLVWREGQMWPEEAQIEDYLVRLAHHER